ncbi:uncharacterized protein HD556DRAFT_1450849 [Suillus plorans]|uniref:Uncharacterized protein n=1 Tax=Suillus plorans TaxID=116603 RepID=A0A9P7DAS9_9AGAM|nr:uncharacterized protein HD556DRAFT_1450849 [Suillus plorans]KAG1785343.1 hypothetical protein HD556DRAFT_1450849 [Suillus plorans]
MNHFAGYDASVDVHDTTTGVHPPMLPPQHVVPQRCPSPDSLLSDPNDSGILAPPDADHLDDEDTGLSTETVARLKFPLQFTLSLEGITTAAVKLYLPHSASDKDA